MNPEQIEKLIRELLKTGEILATEAFRISVQQIRAEIAQGIFLLVFMIVAFFVGIWLYRKSKNSDGYDFWDGLEIVGFLVSAGSIVGMLAIIPQLIGRVMNPEWYAVKLLTETFLK
jgi:hypothetical protein